MLLDQIPSAIIITSVLVYLQWLFMSVVVHLFCVCFGVELNIFYLFIYFFPILVFRRSYIFTYYDCLSSGGFL